MLFRGLLPLSESFVCITFLFLAFLGSTTKTSARWTSFTEQPCYDGEWGSSLEEPIRNNPLDKNPTDVTKFHTVGDGEAKHVKAFLKQNPWIKNTIDVTKFGAVGDGRTDDIKAFQLAWDAACKANPNEATITIPGKMTFFISPIEFRGPCKSPINFIILGTLLAPPMNAWKGNYDAWLQFTNVNGLLVDGQRQGFIDGQGSLWWNKLYFNDDDNNNYVGKSGRPTALKFTNCDNLRVQGSNLRNSPKNHISIDSSNGVQVSNLSIVAPENSPNTDGIDISNSSNIFIQDSVIASGDDCIAINGGTSNVNISNVACGPGHGISVGSLGRNGMRDEVQGISISYCTFTKTDNGVRIKTWQGGSGFAKNINFTNIKFIEANNPIIIDQYYCPDMSCTNQTSAIKISDVRFVGLNGTSVDKEATIDLNCSQTSHCENIILQDINIVPAYPGIPNVARCTNVYGQVVGAVTPEVTCIQKS